MFMKKVLLASASKDFLKRNTALMLDKGFLFVTATSGLEALRLHEEHIFDLILSDLELGDMDGCRFSSEVHKRDTQAPTPVIMICFDTVECINRVKKSCASAIIPRPINPTNLLITIGSFIDMQLARSKRVIFNSDVLCLKQELEFSCFSHDLSATGILLEADHKLELEDRMICQFDLPGISKVKTEGKVTRCFSTAEGKMLNGVKYIDLPLPARSAIQRYVFLYGHLGVKERTDQV